MCYIHFWGCSALNTKIFNVDIKGLIPTLTP
uniref:Uncharacterized protein n=1 Tax=Anguilla anguilla TaxID=7936 RepID=A0A0E9S763_ANGAN